MGIFKKIFSEAFGSFFIVFIGCGSIIIEYLKRGFITQIGIAACFGISVLLMVYLFYRISQAHFNPAITFAFFIIGKIDIKDTIIYILSQLLGGIIAGVILSLLFTKTANLGAIMVDEGIISRFEISVNAFVIITEFIFSFFLMFVYSFIMTQKDKNKKKLFLLIGLTYFICFLFLSPFTGCGLNPIRVLIPAIFTLQFKFVISFLIGIFSGAITGGITHQLLFRKI